MSNPKEYSDSTPLQGHQNHNRDVVIQVGSPKDYRKLAIGSIICGLSCIGIMSLIYSVKTREINKRTPKEENNAKIYSRKALKYGIIAILLWVALIVMFPLLMGLLSYLLTFID